MINIENLTVKYDKTVLDNINLSFPEKGVFCIFAPSGTGKTTLFNAIAGLRKYSGRIQVNGKISYLFQEDRLLNWLTAMENIMLIEPDKDKATDYIVSFGVDEFIDEMPKNLSGGMKRRVALVRALAFDADVYLLDEPFKGLDEVNAQKVRDVILDISKERLVLIVTHDEQDALKLSAEVVLLQNV